MRVLNAIFACELFSPIIELVILDPYNEREFLDHKLSIVDVNARDEQGRIYQIEIQLLSIPDLPACISIPGPISKPPPSLESPGILAIPRQKPRLGTTAKVRLGQAPI